MAAFTSFCACSHSSLSPFMMASCSGSMTVSWVHLSSWAMKFELLGLRAKDMCVVPFLEALVLWRCAASLLTAGLQNGRGPRRSQADRLPLLWGRRAIYAHRAVALGGIKKHRVPFSKAGA